jgi:long-chain acyl-CoA synthetase
MALENPAGDGTGTVDKPAPDRETTALGERPWLSDYPEGIDWDAPIDMTPVTERIRQAVERHGDRSALDFLGKSTSYRELGQSIDALAGALQKDLGVTKGTRVAILLPNTPFFVIAYYAILRAGGVVVNCNPLFTIGELEHVVGHSGAKILITADLAQLYGSAEKLHAAGIVETIVLARFSDALPGLKSILFNLFKRGDIAETTGSTASKAIVPLHRLLSAGRKPEPVEITETDIAVQQYTGGTTGFPKAAMLSHGNIAANLGQIALYGPNVFEAPAKIVAILPFFHIFGMTVCLNTPLANGGEVLMLPRFEIKSFLDLVKRTRPTVLPSVPTLLHKIATDPLTRNYDLSSITLSISGGAPLANETRDLFAKVCGANLAEGYGLTETSPVVACSGLRSETKRGSIGMPLPGTDVRFAELDDPAMPVAQGNSGELQVKGPQVMPGYFQNEDANKAAFVDGWFRTGDVGYFDEQGFIYLVDRIKDIIIVSGYNIFPHDVEAALLRHSAVDECTVIGAPDVAKGEVPVAFIKLVSPEAATHAELVEFAQSNLSRLQVPREIIIKDELPKTLIGKLSKKELRAEYSHDNTGDQES